MASDHEDFAAWLLESKSAGKKGEDDDVNTSKEHIKWTKLHEEIFRQADLDRPARLDSILEGRALENGLHLSRRQQEIVVYMHHQAVQKGLINMEGQGASKYVIVEITQTLGRNPMGADCVP